MTNTAQDNTLIDSIANSVGRTIMSQNSNAPPPFAPFAPMFQSQPIPYVNPAFAQQYNPSAQQFPQQFYGQQFSGPQGFSNNGGKPPDAIRAASKDVLAGLKRNDIRGVWVPRNPLSSKAVVACSAPAAPYLSLWKERRRSDADAGLPPRERRLVVAIL